MKEMISNNSNYKMFYSPKKLLLKSQQQLCAFLPGKQKVSYRENFSAVVTRLTIKRNPQFGVE